MEDKVKDKSEKILFLIAEMIFSYLYSRISGENYIVKKFSTWKSELDLLKDMLYESEG